MNHKNKQRKNGYIFTDRPHPEKREGEVLLCNATSEDFADIGRKTKRLGILPYNRYGEPLKRANFFPVFVSRAEIEAAGFQVVIEEYESRQAFEARMLEAELLLRVPVEMLPFF